MRNYKPLKQPEGTAEGILAGATGSGAGPDRTDKVSLSLKVDRALRIGLKTRAAELGRTMEDCVAEAIRDWMDGRGNGEHGNRDRRDA